MLPNVHYIIRIGKLLIGRGIGKGRVCKPHRLAPSVEDSVETLEKGEPEDEVKAFPAGCPEITNYEVDVSWSPTNDAVQRHWPYLRIRSKLKSAL